MGGRQKVSMAVVAGAVTVMVAWVVRPGAVADAAVVPNVTVSDATIVEGDSGSPFLTFTVSYDQPTDITTNFRVRTVDGTATTPADYASQDIGVTFLPGAVGPTTFTVPVVPDLLGEGDETLTFEIYDPGPGINIADGTGTGTITDDDTIPNVTLNDATIVEGDSGSPFLTFTITYDQPAETTTNFHVRTVDGTATAPDDYIAQDVAITFLGGAVGPATITVPVVPDLDFEADETLSFEIYDPGPGINVADGTATGNIINDDVNPDPPTITIGDAAVPEGDAGPTSIEFPVSLSHASLQPVTVTATTGGGTATTGDDFAATTLDLTFMPGEIGPLVVSVPVLGDTLVEGDEAFVVTLSDPVEGIVADVSASGTINDDDVTLGFAPPAVSTAEGDGAAHDVVLTVAITAPRAVDTVVPVRVEAGTATEGVDFLPLPAGAAVTIPAGSTTGTVSVSVLGDAVDEPDETFRVVTAEVGGASSAGSFVAALVPSAGTLVTIVDDDAAPAPPTAPPPSASGGAPPATLPRTGGADARPIVGLGFALIGVGLVLCRFRRRLG